MHRTKLQDYVLAYDKCIGEHKAALNMLEVNHKDFLLLKSPFLENVANHFRKTEELERIFESSGVKKKLKNAKQRAEKI